MFSDVVRNKSTRARARLSVFRNIKSGASFRPRKVTLNDVSAMSDGRVVTYRKELCDSLGKVMRLSMVCMCVAASSLRTTRGGRIYCATVVRGVAVLLEAAVPVRLYSLRDGRMRRGCTTRGGCSRCGCRYFARTNIASHIAKCDIHYRKCTDKPISLNQQNL